MSERPKVLASKASVGRPTEGSNPSVTASQMASELQELGDSGPLLLLRKTPSPGIGTEPDSVVRR